MTLDELKEKSLQLPYSPGVYIMRNHANDVIYVGKAKKLKNRVSQYFQDTANHSPKTRLMVTKIDHFDVIVAASEFEALVLECSLIKRYMPKYNILLKDDKGYPYVRLDMKSQYPTLSMVSKIADDGAEYYGPYGSRGTTTGILNAVRSILKLPDCKKRFPADIGKGRPCLNFHMNQCAGWCRGELPASEYMRRIEQARQLLNGNYKELSTQLRNEMHAAAENMDFELAAGLRDRLQAVEALGQKQLVTALSLYDTDVIGYAQTEAKACFSVLHFSDGNLLDKDFEVFPIPDDSEAAVSALLKQYYLNRGAAPKVVLLPFAVEDSDLFAQLMEQHTGKRLHIHVPQRGNNVRLVELAIKNAFEEATRVTSKEEKITGSLNLLGKMLMIEPPVRMESFDISNISGTDIVASMVVFENGRPKKSDYKKYKLVGLADQDDYESMRQVLQRRFRRYTEQDKGFDIAPNLLLIDGGLNHARIAREVLESFHLEIPVVGMVKDNRHRTRALVTPEGSEIGIDTQQAVFSLIGNIQEETHRFAINYHRQLRSKRLRYSQLDEIPGIGERRKQQLLKNFKSLDGIKAAALSELRRCLPVDAAQNVYKYFHSEVTGD